MTERKWRVISATGRPDFYTKIEKYETMGYVLLPESFNRLPNGKIACLMKHKGYE